MCGCLLSYSGNVAVLHYKCFVFFPVTFKCTHIFVIGVPDVRRVEYSSAKKYIYLISVNVTATMTFFYSFVYLCMVGIESL